MSVAQPRARVGFRASALTVAAVIALAIGVSALAVGITTPAGLLLAASSVTLDVVIVLQHPSRRVTAVGSIVGMLLLVGILVLALLTVSGG